MRIRSSQLSIISWRALNQADTSLSKSLQKLSSGLRISQAADDAAGLSMSQSILGQVNGLRRANQNAVDGISLLQVADGSLQEIHALLGRANQLAVQAANGTLTVTDREAVQTEVDQILAEIDRISETTTFNGRNILSKGGNSAAVSKVVTGLRSGWLRNAADVIAANYGISGDGVPLRIVLEDTGNEAAWVTGTPGVGNRLDNLALHINLAQISLDDSPDGGSGPLYNDRKIARALTQAVLARHSEYYNLPEWFRSGVADYIAGANEQLDQEITTNTLAGVINATSTPWAEDSLHESSAYLAVRYLAYRLGPFSMSDFMSFMSGGVDFETALSLTAGLSSATLLADFQAAGPGGGADYASTLVLNDPNDVGGIGGGSASTVIPNGGSYVDNPLAPGFNLELDAGLEPERMVLQVGANQGETIQFEISTVSTLTLNLLGIDMVNAPGNAIPKFQTAINTVSSMRGYLGGIANRLDHVVSSNSVGIENQTSSRSRLVDVDMASELAAYTRSQVQLSSSAAIMAQANSLREHVLWLLRDLVGGGGWEAVRR